MDDRSLGTDYLSVNRRWVVVVFGVLLVIVIAAVAVFQFSSGLPTPSSTTTSETGLIYIETVEGNGEVVAVGDMVSVHYTGYLEDGSVFDSSLARNAPLIFMVGQQAVIPGWDEGVQGMRPGGKRELTVPPDLAYGEAGAGDVIPPNATLTFEIELIDILSVDFVDQAIGSGVAVGAGDIVSLAYTVSIAGGEQLDSTADHGQLLTFPIGGTRMIPGLELGVIGMMVGGARTITIPPDLAFGEAGAGDLVPPNATLIFDVELVNIGS
jgi:peptidylprolyl isomerase